MNLETLWNLLVEHFNLFILKWSHFETQVSWSIAGLHHQPIQSNFNSYPSLWQNTNPKKHTKAPCQRRRRNNPGHNIDFGGNSMLSLRFRLVEPAIINMWGEGNTLEWRFRSLTPLLVSKFYITYMKILEWYRYFMIFHQWTNKFASAFVFGFPGSTIRITAMKTVRCGRARLKCFDMYWRQEKEESFGIKETKTSWIYECFAMFCLSLARYDVCHFRISWVLDTSM